MAWRRPWRICVKRSAWREEMRALFARFKRGEPYRKKIELGREP
jgi:hypothetical protein